MFGVAAESAKEMVGLTGGGSVTKLLVSGVVLCEY